MLLLTEAVSELNQKRHGGDKVSLHERLLASRIRRDGGSVSGSEKSLSSGYLYQSSENTRSIAAYPITYPYSQSIASSSRSCRPVGCPVDEWNKVRAGCFVHEKQVAEYLSSFELAFEPELSCLLHANPEVKKI
jgi:hypothetical protein